MDKQTTSEWKRIQTEYGNDDHQYYYYNNTTGESVWTLPEGTSIDGDITTQNGHHNVNLAHNSAVSTVNPLAVFNNAPPPPPARSRFDVMRGTVSRVFLKENERSGYQQQHQVAGNFNEPMNNHPVFGDHGVNDSSVLVTSISEKSATPGQKIICRIFLVILNVALLWGTSLNAIEGIVEEFIKIPLFADVEESFKVTWSELENQRVTYNNCLDRQFNNCNITMNLALDNEVKRTENVFEYNKNQVSRAKDHQYNCTTSYNTIILMLQELNEEYKTELVYNEICSSEEKTLLSTLSGDSDLVKEAAMTSIVSYDVSVSNHQNSLTGYVRDRRSYDSQYVSEMLNTRENYEKVYSEMESAMNALKDRGIANPFKDVDLNLDEAFYCSSFKEAADKPDTVCDRFSESYEDKMAAARESLRRLQADKVAVAKEYVETALEKAEEDYNAEKKMWKEKYDKMKSDLDAALKNYKLFNNFFSVLQTVGSLFFVYDFAIPLELNMQAPSFDPVDFDDFKPPKLPNLDSVLPNLNAPEFALTSPNLTPLREKVENSFNHAENELSKAKSSAETEVKEVTEATKTLVDKVSGIPTPFTDYDPPAFDVDAWTNQYSLMSNTHKSEVAVQLGQLHALTGGKKSNISSAVNSSFAIISDEGSTIFKRASNFTSLFSYEQPTLGDIDFEAFKKTLLDMLYYLADVDTIFRVIRTLMIVLRYLSKGFMTLPIVNVQTKNRGNRNAFLTAILKVGSWIAAQLVVPLILFCTMFVAATMLVLSLYTPWFNAFNSGCLESSNGTVITDNLFALAFNYASQDGNAKAAKGMERYNVHVTEVCSHYIETTGLQNKEHIRDVRAYQTTHLDHRNKFDVAQKCLDSEEMFQNSLSPSPDYCNDTSIDSIKLLGKSVFNCQQIPECKRECVPGVSKEVIKRYTWKTGCTAEKFVHAGFLTYALTILGYVTLNAVRMLLVAGFRNMFWKFLHDGNFSFQSTADRNGLSKLPAQLGSENNAARFQLYLKYKIDKELVKVERFGFLLFFTAFLITLPWFIMLINSNTMLSKQYGI